MASGQYTKGYVVQSPSEHETSLHACVASAGKQPRSGCHVCKTKNAMRYPRDHGQAIAAIRGHDFITPDDIKRLAPAILCHRIILKPESRLRKVTTRAIVDELLDTVPVPTGQSRVMV